MCTVEPRSAPTAAAALSICIPVSGSQTTLHAGPRPTPRTGIAPTASKCPFERAWMEESERANHRSVDRTGAALDRRDVPRLETSGKRRRNLLASKRPTPRRPLSSNPSSLIDHTRSPIASISSAFSPLLPSRITLLASQAHNVGPGVWMPRLRAPSVTTTRARPPCRMLCLLSNLFWDDCVPLWQHV
ncbi:hypothetical protein K466DRAFT_589983 [Polyporus arcularius HHB13444]|uniref:Uncharacterized protein n=1 Tax=Polyporus arcularius HHB13444 TaxID=1314778 RepID=A0A5C3P0I5_9APHY|nr:hypothetical protein K466DRAFT_589983 [Polyporus arcularius HHB13444]